MSPTEIDIINEKMMALQATKPARAVDDEKIEKEDEILDWLDLNNVSECDDNMAENLVEFGITEEDLDDLKDKINKDDFSPILLWINNSLTTERMVADIQEASKRIADLVGSVKTFTQYGPRRRKRGDRYPYRHQKYADDA
ncbi:hypothetical protein PEC18_29930 [Paucibacter sp. O1-1]|nr:hypothetical protein [Paucibacter sp. O1-1]MDA3829947.1 hypothetical protein [Paucibacter sp. O1-1]